MALDQINQYPITTVEIDELGFFDLDNWTGSLFESQKVPVSVMRKAFSTSPIQFYASDLTSALTVGLLEVEIRLPYGFFITEVRAGVKTAPTGDDLIIDLLEDGVSFLSTELSIDAGEKTSVTAAIPAVISVPTLVDDRVITVDISQIGSTIAGAGLFITINGYRL